MISLPSGLCRSCILYVGLLRQIDVNRSYPFSVYVALRAALSRPKAPFFARELEAVRCAFIQVASIITVQRSVCPPDRPSIIRMKTAAVFHPFQLF